MYVCICNNLTSKKVKEAMEKGVCNYKGVYSFYGCQPKCGKCIDFMSDIVSEKINLADASNY